MDLRLEISYFVVALNCLFFVLGLIWLVPQLLAKLQQYFKWQSRNDDYSIDFSHRSLRPAIFQRHIQQLHDNKEGENRPLLDGDENVTTHFKDT